MDEMKRAPAVSGVIPYLTLSDANAAAELYKEAFGAEELGRFAAEDGKRLMHCHLRLNGADLMLCDGFPEYGHPAKPPEAFNLLVQVEDVDALWQRATGAGLEVVMKLEKQFWGDRYGLLRDRFGVVWALSQPGG
jgi:uncharacterized glyoxalase superfamily protein PhnB